MYLRLCELHVRVAHDDVRSGHRLNEIRHADQHVVGFAFLRAVIDDENSLHPKRLPDVRLQGGRAHHRITLFASPRRPEFRHVAQRTIHAPLGWWVGVRAHEVPEELRSIELTPHLRPAEEEALLGCEAVDNWLRMRSEG